MLNREYFTFGTIIGGFFNQRGETLHDDSYPWNQIFGYSVGLSFNPLFPIPISVGVGIANDDILEAYVFLTVSQ